LPVFPWGNLIELVDFSAPDFYAGAFCFRADYYFSILSPYGRSPEGREEQKSSYCGVLLIDFRNRHFQASDV
jgi:hypothetical protein